MNRIRTNVVTSILVVCGAAAGAIAQPVYIGGHEYAALGSAVASSSSDGRTLTVHNIGSSGQDGVEIFSASLFGAGLVYTRDGGTPPPPPGSSSSLGIRSSSGAIISTRTSVSNSDTSVTHTFDYAALGAISVRVVRLDEHGVEISNQVFPGPIGEVTMMPPCAVESPMRAAGR